MTNTAPMTLSYRGIPLQPTFRMVGLLLRRFIPASEVRARVSCSYWLLSRGCRVVRPSRAGNEYRTKDEIFVTTEGYTGAIFLLR